MRSIFFLLALLAGCESLKDRTKYLTGADAFDWQGDNRFVVRAQTKMWGQVDVHDDLLDVFAWGFPPGTRLSLGDGKATIGDNGYGAFHTTITSMLGAVPFGKFMDTKIDSLTLVVQSPGGAPISLRAPSKNTYGLNGVLLKITSGPVLFGDEAVDAPIRNVVWLDWMGDNPVFGQRPRLFKEVDALAIIKRSDGPTRTCTGYTGEDGKAAPDIKLHLKPAQATVYARRTGKVIAERTFPAVDTCPSFATGGKNELIDRDSDLPEADLKAWMESQISQSR